MFTRLFFLFLVFITTLACQSDRRIPFTITGKVTNLNGTTVSLEQFGIVYDVEVIKNDSFSLSGNLTSMEMCEVMFKGVDYRGESGKITRWRHDVSVFVEPGANYKLITNGPDDLLHNNYQVESTSIHQNIYAKYNAEEQKERRRIREKLADLDVKSSAAINNDTLCQIYLDSISAFEDKMKQSRHVVYRKLMTQNPNTYASIYIASKAYDISYDLPFYEGLYKRLDKQYRNHDYGIAFKKKLDDALKTKKQ